MPSEPGELKPPPVPEEEEEPGELKPPPVPQEEEPGELKPPPVPDKNSSESEVLDEPPVPETKNAPCCFFTYSDEKSGGGTFKSGDDHDKHALAFKWVKVDAKGKPIKGPDGKTIPLCPGRVLNCALDATKNPFGVRFCNLRGTETTYRSLTEAAEQLKCGAQRHLTLYHANPEWGMRMCRAVISACKKYTDRPINSQHINMGCSTFGDASKICKAASQVADQFKKRCDKFQNESFVLTGNTVDNWFPASPGSCSWRFPDGHAGDSNYETLRKLKVTKDGFIACKKKNGKWVDDSSFCRGVPNYLAPGNSKRPTSLSCANTN